MNYQTTALRRALAADYAIGLMPATARRRFDALLLEDAALRVELGHWQDALASLTGALPERPVPNHVGRHQGTDRAASAACASEEAVLDELPSAGGCVRGRRRRVGRRALSA